MKPAIGQNARILILGSLPGDESLRKQEYYGNPRNRFWSIMEAILGEKVPEQYSNKIEYLERHGIALWDVLNKAEREGSLDSNILNEEFNDIASLIVRNPSIEAIVTNGGKAAKAFKKYLRINPLQGIKIYNCKSTSAMSLCSGWNPERLIEQWGKII